MNVFAYSNSAPIPVARLLAGWLVVAACTATESWSQSRAQGTPLDLAAALQVARTTGPLRKLADARERAGTGRDGGGQRLNGCGPAGRAGEASTGASGSHTVNSVRPGWLCTVTRP